MGFFQRIGNALSRFMYGRNGVDPLSMALVWATVVLDIINLFIKVNVPHQMVKILSFALFLWACFRMFSKNLYRRREENDWFVGKLWRPVKRKVSDVKQRSTDKEHKYFTCPNCHTVCRVPRGKGKIVITCPGCHGEIHAKS